MNKFCTYRQDSRILKVFLSATGVHLEKTTMTINNINLVRKILVAKLQFSRYVEELLFVAAGIAVIIVSSYKLDDRASIPRRSKRFFL
jgi:hypothetical protein